MSWREISYGSSDSYKHSQRKRLASLLSSRLIITIRRDNSKEKEENLPSFLELSSMKTTIKIFMLLLFTFSFICQIYIERQRNQICRNILIFVGRGFNKHCPRICLSCMQNLEDLLGLTSLSCKLWTPLESLHLEVSRFTSLCLPWETYKTSNLST